MFISPPSIIQLEERLRKRGTESEENILIRLSQASNEILYSNINGNFDSIIINNDIDIAISDIINKIQIWYPNFNFNVLI